MRKLQSLAGGMALIVALVFSAQPSAAQSLLQRMFGFGAAPRSEAPDRMGGYGYGYSRWDDGGFQEDNGSYRTMCVRLCDGFYFPISDNVRRERLYRDSHTCARRCDGEARLFYYSRQGGSVETMVDMSGRPYLELPNAFKYRKSLVSGCACKPAPWSPQEAARHAGYAAQAASGAVADVPDPIEERLRQLSEARHAAEGQGPYYERGYAPEGQGYAAEDEAMRDGPDGYGELDYAEESPSYRRSRERHDYTPWRREPWGVGAGDAAGGGDDESDERGWRDQNAGGAFGWR